MGNVVQFPTPVPLERAATCGCGSQTFILVVKQDSDEPDFVYCTECRYKMSRLMWTWTD